MIIPGISRKVFRHTFKTLLVSLLLGASVDAAAVTDTEMDKAKAIAAKFYIRYENNASGYLDNWTPSSMSELEGKLKNEKDRQSLRDFKSAPVPSGYSSWDKEKLISYWSDTFFKENASHLNKTGATNQEAKNKIKASIRGMSVSAPAPAETPKPAPAEPAQEAQAEQPESQPEVVAPEPASTPLEFSNEQDNLTQQIDDVQEDLAEAEEARNEAEEMSASDESSGSGTWVYIMILGILVVIVIVLVAYASRTMKGQAKPEKKPEEKPSPKEEREKKQREKKADDYSPRVAEYTASLADDSRMREKYAENLAAKSEEIRSLNRQVNEIETLAADLKEENRRLKAELERMRASKHEEAERRRQERAEIIARAEEDRKNAKGSDSLQPKAAGQQKPAGRTGEPREIYLGRVNSKGLFVRADRHAVDGQSIYKLTTFNGVSGTFTLINNPIIEEQMLDDPGKWLAGGCFAKDIFDTEGREGIYTETPGTAVFKDGAWRVERKAKIRYE